MHLSKRIVYACIVLFGIALLYSFVAIINVALKQATTSVTRELIQAKQQKAVADSLNTVATKQVDIAFKQKTFDSLLYRNEKKNLLSGFQTQQKKHEVNLAALDTITDSTINLRFSVRQMLSDSAVKLWR